MKKALLGMALVFGLGLVGISDAQAQGITLGAQGGYNYAELSDLPTDTDEIGKKGGLVLGAFVDIQFHSMLFLSVEGNYVEQKNDVTDTDGTTEFKQNFIQIPALLGVRLLSGMVQPVLYAGASASFETKCQITPEDFSALDCTDPLVDLSTNSALWSAVFGGGVNVALGPVILNGDIRYNLGLSTIIDEAGEESKWNSWMVLVGIGFGLGG